MIRTLVMIAVSGFLLAAVCLSVAVGMAGPEAIERGVWSWSDDGWFAHHVEMHDGWSASRSGPDGASRTFALANGEKLAIDVPGHVVFTQAEGPAKVVARGPKEALDHLVINNGEIRFDRSSYDGDDLTLEITAPKITDFAINGEAHLEVRGYKQDLLALHINGDGSAVVAGKANVARLSISGSGEADLSGLGAEGAEVNISGSGEAKVAPKSWAKLDISGSGDIDLLSHPKRLESHVSGSGEIRQDDSAPDDGVSASPSPSPSPSPPPGPKPART
ncbi:GIN domain-containing protein [Phenylobacterium soli]|uniref:Putative auto-transporter adhesin head GIN domain-containing protein n=1 Tax=Phenylobacterium soli TaxID=2170551 RepID=A0A328AJX8_9CAUL|nr:DUF2807 domain-containing protein [Phenylobacterium soli]RAK55263.1 hypothetical protein DJ017_12420 [Phenylobacterium soli]